MFTETQSTSWHYAALKERNSGSERSNLSQVTYICLLQYSQVSEENGFWNLQLVITPCGSNKKEKLLFGMKLELTPLWIPLNAIKVTSCPAGAIVIHYFLLSIKG